MVRRWISLSAAVLLAGCAGRPAAVAEAPAPVTLVAVPTAPPAPTPIDAGLTPATTLWHLRAGLNVAALACRGPDEAVLTARYNAMLAGHAAALAGAEAAYAAEYQAGGGDWRDRYDDAMTQLYNFFSQTGGRIAFCASASQALADLATVSDADLPAFAAGRLPLLDRPFAPPRLEVDARVFAAPPTVMVAAR